AQKAAKVAALAVKDELEAKIGERLTGDEVSRLIKETNDISQMRLQADMAEKNNVIQTQIHDVQAQVRQHGNDMNAMWIQRDKDTKFVHQMIQSNSQELFKIMERQDKDSKETSTRLEQLMLTQSEDRVAMLELASNNNTTSSASGASGGPTPATQTPPVP
ncbi:unnamed protein product, partial [Meganyctiphanes norvegica]